MKLNQLRRIIKEEILREIKVSVIGNLIIDPQIQNYINNNPDSNQAWNYEKTLPGLKGIYERIRNLKLIHPVNFEIGIIRDYPWLAEAYTGHYNDDGFNSEDELVLMAKKGSKEFAIQGEDVGQEIFVAHADANTKEGDKIVNRNFANEPDIMADFEPILNAFVEWSKL